MYRLLIVDDEKMIRMGIKNGVSWNELGISEVYTAASAREALGVIEEQHPQIMITDISMTEMSGLDLIAAIRKDSANDEMRILVLTGYDRFDYARECLRMKVHNFLLKPIDEQELKESVEEQIRILEKERKENLLKNEKVLAEAAGRQLQLESFMRDVVHQRIKDVAGKWPEELEQKRHHPAVAAVLILDIYMDIKNESEERFREFEIRKSCLDLIDARGIGVTFYDDNGRIVMVFQSDQNKQSVMESVQEITEILENEHGVRLRVLLGGEVESLEQISASYKEALLFLKQEQKEIEKIIRIGKDKNRENMIQDVYREFKISMCDNIADGERLMQIYEKFCRAMTAYNLSDRQIQIWCFEMSCAIYYTYVTATGETPECQLNDLAKAINGLDREMVYELTGSFIRKLALGREGKRHEIVEKAKRYIDMHLDEDLSIVGLSEMVYVSPSYFSRLFKKVLGEGCNEYIVRQRIEKSKYFLETTEMQIGEIAKMVGYKNVNYFSLAFKKYNGMSPAKYREMAENTTYA